MYSRNSSDAPSHQCRSSIAINAGRLSSAVASSVNSPCESARSPPATTSSETSPVPASACSCCGRARRAATRCRAGRQFAQLGGEQLGRDAERDRLLELGSGGPEDPHPARARGVERRLVQPRLAHARVALDQQHLAAAGLGPVRGSGRSRAAPHRARATPSFRVLRVLVCQAPPAPASTRPYTQKFSVLTSGTAQILGSLPGAKASPAKDPSPRGRGHHASASDDRDRLRADRRVRRAARMRNPAASAAGSSWPLRSSTHGPGSPGPRDATEASPGPAETLGSLPGAKKFGQVYLHATTCEG